MISIITAIHNGFPVNRIFIEYLEKNTFYPYELIIIDNNSNDGSKELFLRHGARIIQNKENYSYPYCQNQGIKAAKFDVFAFLNNDVILPPHWDKKLLAVADAHGLEIITPCGIEQVETVQKTKKLKRRWKLIRNFILLRHTVFNFKLAHRLMYGNWERFCKKRYSKFGNKIKEGFVGNSVIARKSAIEKAGMWDERIQAADFDIYMRSKKRSMEQGDIKPVHIALGVFVHHFIKVTAKSGPPKFSDQQKLIPLEEKWSEKERALYLKDMEQI